MSSEDKIDYIVKELGQMDNRLTKIENKQQKIYNTAVGIAIGLIIGLVVFGVITVKEALEVVK